MEKIDRRWYGTLEFLAGMLDEERAIELIEEMSRSYLDAKISSPNKEPCLSALHHLARCMAERGYLLARHHQNEGLVTILSDSFIRITTYHDEINLVENIVEIVAKCDSKILQEVHRAWLNTVLKSVVVVISDTSRRDHYYYLASDDGKDDDYYTSNENKD